VTSPRPQVVDAEALAAAAIDRGAQWSLTGDRELEANVVHVPANDAIAEHVSGVDVVIVGVAGDGTVTISTQAWGLRAGMLIFVPRGAPRSVRAGGSGLTYLTVHRRRDEGLTVGRPRPGGGRD
jgi:quercetin dioxygenase-like cupin family protein